MAFRKIEIAPRAAASPEELFRDLKGKTVRGLLAQQADLLRTYSPFAERSTDVALQLPTGAGKTLVGLLIAEWRRRRFGETAVYLCPTRQLVNQVVEAANSKYGINARALIGSKKEFDKSDAAAYVTAAAVGVTTYWSLFNVKPFFESPGTIVLDDVHAAEQPIAEMWSLRLTRSADDGAYQSLLGALEGCLPDAQYQRLRSESMDQQDLSWIDVVPAPRIEPIVAKVEAVLDACCSDGDYAYKWRLLRGHLDACLVLVSWREILIRPLVPPTFSHAPFETAKHRVYMSATLGAGGDLERITGRRVIERAPPPAGYERQGVGRRLFLFPGCSQDEVGCRGVVNSLASTCGRTLCLVPSNDRAKEVMAWLDPGEKAAWFDGESLEDSKAAFVSSNSAVALVANRYDGIDLPDDECRLLVVDGFPGAANLLEQFLVSRMKAGVLLEERIASRLAQGFGRCTRSENDFSIVVALGEDLAQHLMTASRRTCFHPEMQAELQFGIEQSQRVTAKEMLENAAAFLAQNAEWQEAEAQIVALRNASHQAERDGDADLRRAVSYEIDYARSRWYGNDEGALDAAEHVRGALTSPALRGYRALWSYLAGCSASRLAQAQRPGMAAKARAHFRDAGEAAPAVRWLHDLAGDVGRAPPVGLSFYRTAEQAVFERLSGAMTKHQMNARSFEEQVSSVLTGLRKTSTPDFESAHAALGRLLGFQAGHSTEDGSPDAWWIADESLCVVFEDNVDGKQSSAVPLKKVRQAATHAAWIKDNVPQAKSANVISVFVTHHEAIEPSAKSVAKEVCLWRLHDFREWAQRAINVIREVRPTYPGFPNPGWEDDVRSRQTAKGVDLDTLITVLRSNTVANLNVR